MTRWRGPRRGAACAAVVAAAVAAACAPSGRAASRPAPAPAALHDSIPFAVPLVDLAGDTARQMVVDREPGQYLGHPTTVLLGDGRTIIAVYPRGHGAGAIVMKRSADGGRTWSERLPVPRNWAMAREVPTIYRVPTPAGGHRLLLFSGLYPIRLATSEDEGATWTPLSPIGDFGGIVAMASVAPIAGGRLLAFFHDDGRFLHDAAVRGPFRVFATESADAGLTWGIPRVIAGDTALDLCEPGVVRSPDGRELAALLRENRRRAASQVIFSRDEGRTWTAPRPLSRELTGDRHVARYAPDGRLVVAFRDMAPGSATRGDWLVWVGRYDDLAHGRAGQYRVRLMDNRDGWDAAYAGLERLPDGAFVSTTYGHWQTGAEPYIVSVRFRLDELDRLARAARRREPGRGIR